MREISKQELFDAVLEILEPQQDRSTSSIHITKSLQNSRGDEDWIAEQFYREHECYTRLVTVIAEDLWLLRRSGVKKLTATAMNYLIDRWEYLASVRTQNDEHWGVGAKLGCGNLVPFRIFALFNKL